ncbi:hypothetical protein AL486_09955 [Pandoraea apista]|nr:hypothetical protein AL486_09955 [Pandoraea apista]
MLSFLSIQRTAASAEDSNFPTPIVIGIVLFDGQAFHMRQYEMMFQSIDVSTALGACHDLGTWQMEGSRLQAGRDQFFQFCRTVLRAQFSNGLAFIDVNAKVRIQVSNFVDQKNRCGLRPAPHSVHEMP